MDDEATKVEGRGAAGQARAQRDTGSRYTIGERIGRGGMGEVLAGRDEQFDRDIAIKRMLAEEPSDAQVQRFLREARIQGQLEHPAIVPIHEIGRDTDGRPYFAMKKLAGTTLGEILAVPDGAGVSRQRLLRAFVDVCLASELAHTRGVVHRDIKPDNIMLGDFGETYLLDWGVAKVRGEPDDVAITDGSGLATQTGAAVGTAGYMAPEQARGDRDIDARADVYALGCVLFEILAGQRLHPKGTAGLASVLGPIDARPSMRAPDRDIPPELDALCAQATALEPIERIASARMLADAVQQFLDGDRDMAKRKELATQHLDRALVAFAQDDRRQAMREAGMALALDPTRSRAGELITRLLLEPPQDIPAEVTAEMATEDAQLSRRNARVGMIPNAGFLLFLPAFAISGGIAPWIWLAITACVLLSCAALWYMSRANVTFVRWPIVVLSLAMLVALSRVFSPFLLGIPIAAVTLVGLLAGPSIRMRNALGLAALYSIVLIGTWLAERAHVVSETMNIGGGLLVMRGPIFTSQLATILVLCTATVAFAIGAVWLAYGMRLSDQQARTRLHLVSWQLKQLVG